MMNKNNLYLVVFLTALFLACKPTLNKSTFPKEYFGKWVHLVEKDSADVKTYIRNSDKLEIIRGGRTTFELLENGKVNYETSGSSDKLIFKSGFWSFNNKEQLISFVFDETTTDYYVLSLDKNLLKIKQKTLKSVQKD
ncbi:hypothetical protein [Flammeovirga kamogawensis]|uniref:Lipocalin family protein n=1 Tax=Flammeovirga kamogawensis TaxID=373891 RepID=A0ABX8GQX4_9BACT|nr:hypothetical protein [Flammeovirga kamogawensis]MBB6463244.1 hypothetical protein [Flammeovirga kamogawensis]QWG05906.1 hypothetical protein KM029_11050 [Flammeovirga kamogawensis]TRX67731.1 hypothetical protein EO216_06060 [Flammeovirga kamogawensis]